MNQPMFPCFTRAGLLFCAALLCPAPGAIAQAPDPDYSAADNWLCRAGLPDLSACNVDLSATIVHGDGRLSHEKFQVADNPPVDCFYVYPTVSLDETANSDLHAGPEEYSVIQQQFARFGSRCRTYAPLYRQFTLTALRGAGIGSADREMAYRDVLAAWNHYLENYNNGRGVVLVGHSQGSGVLTRLIRSEIDGRPVQQQILSAMLLGTTVQVPQGEVMGGTFQHMPLCTSAYQNQCIIVYATFRDTVPPAGTSLFARNGPDSEAACTNPAVLAKGNNEVHGYLNSSPQGRTGIARWTEQRAELDTPFASVPGLLTADCVSTDTHHYLQLTVHPDANDARTDIIGGDILTAEGTPDAGWGLHLIDVNVGMGDLLTLVDRQIAAYFAR